MHQGEIDDLVNRGTFPGACPVREIEETHISWVILCQNDVYKIKKPIRYAFLDFSTLEKRKQYCTEEVRLNRRLAPEMYLGVVPVTKQQNDLAIGGDGILIDYAVHMRRMPSDRRMDLLLRQHRVSHHDLDNLAAVLSDFHINAKRYLHDDPGELLVKVNDIGRHADDARQLLGGSYGDLIDEMCHYNEDFVRLRTQLFLMRAETGFYRECHGDLHSRNIFLLDQPVIFDCIEFNEEYRKLDLLNEIAFMCMDLDAFRAQNLSEYFFKACNSINEICRNSDEYMLFLFYKAYRANVRAKVNILRALSSEDNRTPLREARLYLMLMRSYLHELRS